MATGAGAGRESLTAAAAEPRWARPICVVALLSAAFAPLAQPPFAFLSPDGSYHVAKVLRAALGDPFRDPVTGTPSLYPPLFHVVWGTLDRALGLSGQDLARLVTAAQLAAVLAAAFALGNRLLGATHGALTALAIPALFYAPTGRHILTPAPANLAIPLALLGAACLLLPDPRGKGRFLGGLLLGLSANVVWYMSIPLVACIGAMAFLAPRRELRPVLAGAALPFVFLAWHLLAIRSAWSDYSGYGAAEWVRQGGGRLDVAALTEWGRIIVTRANERFLPLVERSRFAAVHYFGAALPAALLTGILSASALARDRRTPRAQKASDPNLLLVVAALLVFALSLPLAVTRDAPRVAAVQFIGWALLLPVALARLRGSGVWARAGRLYLPAAGLLSLWYTVAHRTPAQAYELSAPTRALVSFIRERPGHLEERIFVTDTSVRRLLVEVPFRSLVGHGHGGYYAQDPKSADRMYRAYHSILECRDDWRQQAETFGIRLFAVRPGHPEERAAGECFLRAGRPLLQNAEWWVVEVGR